ncbi:NAD(P)-binding domain-containing protein [Staphylococcus hominis]|uniref:NAD(P)-binding domain-containing protein n=1 Tax=Staphylococcus hominis TaxID=1290 RepID=UPI003D037884
MSGTAQIGVTGLAVMGRNLARNFARNGFTVAVHNRTASRTDALVKEFGEEGTFVAAHTPEEFVAALEYLSEEQSLVVCQVALYHKLSHHVVR